MESIVLIDEVELCLMRSAGEVVAREQVAEAVLGYTFYSSDRSLDMHARRVRRKLDAAANSGVKIKTIPLSGISLYCRALAALKEIEADARTGNSSCPRARGRA
jgi:DNA-binding winged helix-turn-helix (wHTH) protein